MMNTAKKSEPIQHTFSITVNVDPFWIEYLTRYSDIFGRQYAGYWLRGVEHDSKLGWLCWEDDEQHRSGTEPNREEALKSWRAGKLLPANWFRLDRAAALRAWEEGVKKYGFDWYGSNEHDATTEDVLLQLTLLGEVRYG